MAQRLWGLAWTLGLHSRTTHHPPAVLCQDAHINLAAARSYDSSSSKGSTRNSSVLVRLRQQPHSGMLAAQRQKPACPSANFIIELDLGHLHQQQQQQQGRSIIVGWREWALGEGVDGVVDAAMGMVQPCTVITACFGPYVLMVVADRITPSTAAGSAAPTQALPDYHGELTATGAAAADVTPAIADHCLALPMAVMSCLEQMLAGSAEMIQQHLGHCQLPHLVSEATAACQLGTQQQQQDEEPCQQQQQQEWQQQRQPHLPKLQSPAAATANSMHRTGAAAYSEATQSASAPTTGKGWLLGRLPTRWFKHRRPGKKAATAINAELDRSSSGGRAVAGSSCMAGNIHEQAALSTATGGNGAPAWERPHTSAILSNPCTPKAVMALHRHSSSSSDALKRLHLEPNRQHHAPGAGGLLRLWQGSRKGTSSDSVRGLLQPPTADQAAAWAALSNNDCFAAAWATETAQAGLPGQRAQPSPRLGFKLGSGLSTGGQHAGNQGGSWFGSASRRHNNRSGGASAGAAAAANDPASRTANCSAGKSSSMTAELHVDWQQGTFALSQSTTGEQPGNNQPCCCSSCPCQ